MKISCNDCRRQLGEMFENQDANAATAPSQPQVTAEVQQHLAECPECRSEMVLLTAVREEMRAFPVLTAPTDLRSRIRQQLEAEPTKAAAPTNVPENRPGRTITLPAPTLQDDQFQSGRTSTSAANEWQIPQPSKFQSWMERFRAFLRHPSNVAWMSCAVIILFYVVTLSFPKKEPETTAASPSDSLLSQYQQRDAAEDDDHRPQFVAPPLKQPNLAARPADKAPAALPTEPPLTGRMKPPSLLTPFDDTPLPMAKAPASQPKSDTSPDTARAPFMAKLPEPSRNTAPQTQREIAPAPKPQNAAPRTDSTTYAMRPRMAESDERPATKSTPNVGPTGPAGPSGPPAALSAPMRRAESYAAESGDSTGGRSANTLAVREISTRITPPRRVAFGQVSVNLPEGARFSDGSRARVIWRGSAEANEPIDLSFTIQAMPGQQTVKITLQEVRNNDAQMVAFKSLQIGGDH